LGNGVIDLLSLATINAANLDVVPVRSRLLLRGNCVGSMRDWLQDKLYQGASVLINLDFYSTTWWPLSQPFIKVQVSLQEASSIIFNCLKTNLSNY